MDTRDYIESGIIEQYVLGLTSVEETADVENMAIEHVEVKQAIYDFEIMVEQQANENVIHPPAFIKTNIEGALSNKFSAINSKQIPHYKNEGAIIRNLSSLKYIAAAAIILLLFSTGLNFYFYSAFKNTNTKYEALFNERNTLQANNASYRTQIDEMNQSFSVIQDSNMVNITMKGTKGREDNIATVFWNSQTKDVYLISNKLFKTPEGKQYQLWAIVDGKPVNAGMVAYDCNGVCKMSKKIDHAQAFAITLEKQGGSAAPTMEQMYVIGKVS